MKNIKFRKQPPPPFWSWSISHLFVISNLKLKKDQSWHYKKVILTVKVNVLATRTAMSIFSESRKTTNQPTDKTGATQTANDCPNNTISGDRIIHSCQNLIKWQEDLLYCNKYSIKLNYLFLTVFTKGFSRFLS